MSHIAAQARDVLSRVLCGDEKMDRETLQAALEEVKALQPADAYDETVVFEAGETVLRMMDSLPDKP